MSDILDRIDSLVDASLDGGDTGELDVGERYCSKCRREWHGLPITARMYEMRRRGGMDPDYRYADDDSDVMCPGVPYAEAVPAPPPCDCPACVAARAHGDEVVPMPGGGTLIIPAVIVVERRSVAARASVFMQRAAALAEALTQSLWPNEMFGRVSLGWSPPWSPVAFDVIGAAREAWEIRTREGVWRDVVCSAPLKQVEEGSNAYPPRPASALEWWPGTRLYEAPPVEDAPLEPVPDRRETPPMWVDRMRRRR